MSHPNHVIYVSPDMVWVLPPEEESVSTDAGGQTAQEVIDYFAHQGKTVFAIPGQGTLDGPLQRERFTYIPLEQDHSILPKEAIKQLAETEANFAIRQWIVGHEQKRRFPFPMTKPAWEAMKKLVLAGVALAALVAVVFFAVTVALALVSAVGTLLLMGMAVAAFVLVDPQLIAVTQSGEWVVVASHFS